jgi:hypothetical protein
VVCDRYLIVFIRQYPGVDRRGGPRPRAARQTGILMRVGVEAVV